jgi:hypothetical protein
MRPRILIAAAILSGLLCATASAELTQSGNLFVRFSGGISPRALPRNSPAPIAVRIEGTIRTPSGQTPPALRKIKIALNSSGRLSTSGLPRCRQEQVESANPSEALAACGTALVGGGGFTAITSFADQPKYLMHGEILLFNSVVHGHAAILAHIFQKDPVPIVRMVVFKIRRSSGTFGTVISGELPKETANNGYLKSIYLQLQRRYVVNGHPRAYLSASCSAPAGFTEAVFPFARASMTFDDGRTLASTLTRSCAVR